jgi:hypothetical protein
MDLFFSLFLFSKSSILKDIQAIVNGLSGKDNTLPSLIRDLAGGIVE